ncbi:unnamed protein product [Jaminaea pallidilutea]
MSDFGPLGDPNGGREDEGSSSNTQKQARSAFSSRSPYSQSQKPAIDEHLISGSPWAISHDPVWTNETQSVSTPRGPNDSEQVFRYENAAISTPTAEGSASIGQYGALNGKMPTTGDSEAVLSGHSNGDKSNDEEDSSFTYPGVSDKPSQPSRGPYDAQSSGDASEPLQQTTGLLETTASTDANQPSPSDTPATSSTSRPANIDYDQVHKLATSGSLADLQRFFETTSRTNQLSTFALANEPSPASGLMLIHHAAKTGKLDVLRWLVEEAGALVEIEDREGETALHKAALAGRLPVISYLLAKGAAADTADADGWTPLHNACARGYLDIVRYLVENGQASLDVRGGRGGWTPLMNAASNGHMPVVRYFIAKHHVDPFRRNMSGEAAYDVAAASFEMFICEVLQRYEAERWASLRFATASSPAASSAPRSYSALYLHNTVAVLIHQNERLDTHLSTLAVNGGKPRWSGTAAGRPHKADRRAPGTMPPGTFSTSRTRHVPMRREDVLLPVRSEPYKLRKAQPRGRGRAGEELGSTPTPDSVLQGRPSSSTTSDSQDQPSHFWFCDWHIDLTHPQVDPVHGWQYAPSFDTPEEQWTAQIPAALDRVLQGHGISTSISRAISGGAANGRNDDAEAIPSGWVRRRRWMRVMRRRLDIDFGDELEAAELFHELSRGAEGPSPVEKRARDQAQAALEVLPPDADYVVRAKAAAGEDRAVTPADAIDDDSEAVRVKIARLELAMKVLRSEAFGDENVPRRSSAEDLLKEYALQVGQLRQATGFEDDQETEHDEAADHDDDDFVYPNSFKDTQSVISRIAPATEVSALTVRPNIPQRSSSSASIFGVPAEDPPPSSSSRSADLARSQDFRVPTNEAPRNIVSPPMGQTLREATLLPVWERDEDASECRGCGKRFTFFTRKHHCRRCGRIYCADCSSHRAQLPADEVIIDPSTPEMFHSESLGPSRICASCDAERRLPPRLQTPRGAHSVLRNIAASQTALATPSEQDLSDSSSGVTSRASELNECPVCSTTLAILGGQEDQEEHIRNCLENGGGGGASGSGMGGTADSGFHIGNRYLVYKLPEGSPIVGKECVICLEELLGGQPVARLPCLCFFHRNCIDSWLGRGRSCPTHAR